MSIGTTRICLLIYGLNIVHLLYPKRYVPRKLWEEKEHNLGERQRDIAENIAGRK